MDARIVDKYYLTFVCCLYAEDTRSRGLRFVGDDRNLLADYVVEERRFSHIWASDECNVSDFHCFVLHYVRPFGERSLHFFNAEFADAFGADLEDLHR